MAKLLIANEVRIGGLGGGRLQTDDFEALPHLIRVATVVDFEADVPGGNWVTVGFDSPLVGYGPPCARARRGPAGPRRSPREPAAGPQRPAGPR